MQWIENKTFEYPKFISTPFLPEVVSYLPTYLSKQAEDHFSHVMIESTLCLCRYNYDEDLSFLFPASNRLSRGGTNILYEVEFNYASVR